MKISCKVSEAATTLEALADLKHQITLDNLRADAVFTFYGCQHDESLIHSFISEQFPGAAIIGGSSNGGVMNHDKVWGAGSIGIMVLDDPDGDFGASSREIGDNPADTAQAVLHEALANAKCPGELPELIWVYQAPGNEEHVLEGIRRVVGNQCPIIGGSAADETVEGNWSQISDTGYHTNSMVIAVLFPSKGVSFAFQGGHEPSGASGRITRINGTQQARAILEIDGEPASQVYNRWIGHTISDKLEAGGNILAQTTMTPLALDRGQVDGIQQYLLIHPDSVEADGALTTFANVEEGMHIHCMSGDKTQLIERAGRVTKQATALLESDTIAGALVVYCAGCRMAVDEQISNVPAHIRAPLGDAPFLGCFTFGEQGSLMGENVHGNLMISAIVFGA